MANPLYPTIPGMYSWQIVGEWPMGDEMMTSAMGWGVWGTEEDAQKLLSRCLERPANGWENIRVKRGAAIVDSQAMKKIASDLSERTGASVEYDTEYSSGLYVTFRSSVRTRVDPTEEAVLAAVEEMREEFWNQDFHRFGFGSWTTTRPEGMR